jgi:hypothetical protein
LAVRAFSLLTPLASLKVTMTCNLSVGWLLDRNVLTAGASAAVVPADTAGTARVRMIRAAATTPIALTSRCECICFSPPAAVLFGGRATTGGGAASGRSYNSEMA